MGDSNKTSMMNLIVLYALEKSMFPKCLYKNLLYDLILPPNSNLSFIPNFTPVHMV